MKLQIFYSPCICIQIIILDILSRFTLIYCMLNFARYRAKEHRAQHSHESKAKNNEGAITKDVAVMEDKQRNISNDINNTQNGHLSQKLRPFLKWLFYCVRRS